MWNALNIRVMTVRCFKRSFCRVILKRMDRVLWNCRNGEEIIIIKKLKSRGRFENGDNVKLIEL